MKNYPHFRSSVFDVFCKKTAMYPPSEIFAGLVNPTSQQKKAEARIATICEELYALEVGVLRDLRTVMNEVLVLEQFHKNIKSIVFVEKTAELQAHVKYAMERLNGMMKKDPILKDYFDWGLTKEEINSTIFNMVNEIVDDMEAKDIAKAQTPIIVAEYNRIKGVKK
ncbi:hypothetical protein F485_gp209 [Aeromonas phage CC2]|uniref:Uncharacterized protein n=1 Tax=Aeromonas phage CC2 TaxID=1204516 RepID=I6WMB8_9CAUD|nr:hypothetical protein F485_gp209 [Aeromonas phage CC2]AFN39338.1 hypothetical protein CC2_086 [Aeromonas phage CC2]